MKDRNTDITQQLKQKIQTMLPNGFEIYNSIMKEIEPDLVVSNIDTLDEKYANETAEQRQERIQKYARAVQEYDKVASIFFAKLDAAVDEHRSIVEATSSLSEQKSIESLESQLSNE